MHLRRYLLEAGNRFLRVLLPFPIYRRWRAMRGLDALPRIGKVDFGDLRRLSPLCREFGYSRGLPVDRHYIEKFLSEHGEEIHGRCLEIGDDSYTRQFGGNRVIQRDVLHVAEGNPLATFVGDLSNADHLPSNAFDCIILTQTLHLIFDLPDALRTIHRILKPGGVLLATVPGISQVSVDEWAPTWYWSFTIHSAQRLFEERFGKEQIQIQALGNVLAATAFLNGVATQELRPDELDVIDPQYQLLITIRACKSGNS